MDAAAGSPSVGAVNLADLFAPTSISAWDAVLALVIVVAGWIVSSLAKRGTLTLMHRVKGLGESVAVLVARVVRYGLLLLTVGIALTVLGAPLQPVLAAVIIVAAVAYLALRGIATNFGAGLVIQARRLVQLGDEISVLGFSGVVTDLNGRSVILHTVDGRVVHIPNASLLDTPVISNSGAQPHRSEIEVRARTAAPYADVRRTVVDAVRSTPHVRDEPAATALVVSRSPETLTLRVRFWHDAHHHGAIRSAAVCAVLDAFDAAGTEVVVSSDVPPAPLTPAGPF
ncbi:small-conductance mechanosensitive channel MscS [Conyzicola lurida]